MLRIKRELKKSPYWYCRGTVAGITIYESTRTTDKRQAEAYRRRREAEVYDAAALGHQTVGTWSEAVNSYLDHGKSPRFLLPLVDRWGDKPLNEITQQVIDQAARDVYPHVSNSSLCRQLYGPVNAVLRHAERCDISGVSAKKIVFPKVAKRKVTEWATDDYIDQLLFHCDDELRAVVLTMT